jgi:hypothetical protein
MLVSNFWKYALGSAYVNDSAQFEELAKNGGFTDCAENCLVVIFPDMPPADAKNYSSYNNFKPFVTDQYRRTRPMFAPAGKVLNTVMYIGSGQHRSAIKIDGDDRRYFMCDMLPPQNMGDEYFKTLHAALRDHHLLFIQWILSHGSPKKMDIPKTSLRSHAIASSLCNVGQFIYYKLTGGWNVEEWDGKRREFHRCYKDYCKSNKIKALTEQAFFTVLMDKYLFVKKEIANGKSIRFAVKDPKALHEICNWLGELEDRTDEMPEMPEMPELDKCHLDEPDSDSDK